MGCSAFVAWLLRVLDRKERTECNLLYPERLWLMKGGRGGPDIQVNHHKHLTPGVGFLPHDHHRRLNRPINLASIFRWSRSPAASLGLSPLPPKKPAQYREIILAPHLKERRLGVNEPDAQAILSEPWGVIQLKFPGLKARGFSRVLHQHQIAMRNRSAHGRRWR